MNRMLLYIILTMLLFCGCSSDISDNVEKSEHLFEDSVSIFVDKNNRLSVDMADNISLKTILAENEQNKKTNSKQVIDDIYTIVNGIEIYEINPKTIDADGCRIIMGSNMPFILSTSQRKNIVYIWGNNLRNNDEPEYISSSVYSESLYNYIHDLLNVQNVNISDVLSNVMEMDFEYNGVKYKATDDQVENICTNILKSNKKSVLLNSKYPIKLIFKTTNDEAYIAYLSSYLDECNMYMCGKFITVDEVVVDLICNIVNFNI